MPDILVEIRQVVRTFDSLHEDRLSLFIETLELRDRKASALQSRQNAGFVSYVEVRKKFRTGDELRISGEAEQERND
jgi:hypothetical protein